MSLTRLGIGLAILLAVSSASAKDVPLKKTSPNLSGVAGWLKQVEGVVRIRSDPVRRAIVCRVPYMELSIPALVRATKIPKPKIMFAITSLKGMGLVDISNNPSGQWIIVPASPQAREKMRRWAEDWCVSDEECGVMR